MTYLNQFHKEAVERKLQKIAESMKSPMYANDEFVVWDLVPSLSIKCLLIKKEYF
jgi:hypothetical protein